MAGENPTIRSRERRRVHGPSEMDRFRILIMGPVMNIVLPSS